MKRLTIFVIILSALSLYMKAAPAAAKSCETMIDEIEFGLDEFPDRLADRYSHVDSIRAKLRRENRPVAFALLLRDMFSELETLSYDTLLVDCDRFAPKAKSMRLDNLTQWIALKRAEALARRGGIREALKAIDEIEASGIDESNRQTAAEVRLNALYSGAQLTEGLDVQRVYLDEMRAAIDSLQSFYYEGAPSHLLLAGLAADIAGDYATAAAAYKDVMSSQRAGTLIISRAAFLLGQLSKRVGDNDAAVRFYTLGAHTDLKNTDPTGESLGYLGLELLNEGDAQRGRKMLFAAFRNATESGVVAQSRRFAMLMPRELDSLSGDISRESFGNRLIISTLLIVVSLLIFLLIVMRRRLDGARKHGVVLEKANAIKEEAVCNFLEMSAGFQERLEDFTKLTRRKISAGQSDELLAIIKNRDVLDDADNMAVEFFDRGFLMIYPHFVDNVNLLLEDESRVAMSTPDQLTTELRVLAFARLGVADTATVARFLGLSLNTIYTYRNKMRSRARSRETFYDDVMKISAC